MQKPSEVKTFFIRTYGCQMNELDSELMIGQLEKRGMTRCQSEAEADLLLFNTCSIRDLAERKVMGKLGQLGRKKSKQPIIGVTGCMANAKKELFFEKFPHVDFILGTNNIGELGEVLEGVLEKREKEIRVQERFEENLDYLATKRDDPLRAFVSIIRGCDKFCTYCVVPYTRGREVSRSPESILQECQELAQKGYKEITLLGQNVNSYGKDRPEWKMLFHDLLALLDQKAGIQRIRFMTSHPVDITPDLMQAVGSLPSLCEFVHFPFQAGSNRILKKMHRLYTKEIYLEKVALLKKHVPQVALGTDVIVGFPSETEEEFQETYDLFDQVGFSAAFIFAYSSRKGTPAARWKDDIPEEVKQERLQKLLALFSQQQEREMASFIGKTVEVLIEKPKGENENYLKGKTRCWKKVILPGENHLVGSLVQAKVINYRYQTLVAELSAH